MRWVSAEPDSSKNGSKWKNALINQYELNSVVPESPAQLDLISKGMIFFFLNKPF